MQGERNTGLMPNANGCIYFGFSSLLALASIWLLCRAYLFHHSSAPRFIYSLPSFCLYNVGNNNTSFAYCCASRASIFRFRKASARMLKDLSHPCQRYSGTWELGHTSWHAVQRSSQGQIPRSSPKCRCAIRRLHYWCCYVSSICVWLRWSILANWFSSGAISPATAAGAQTMAKMARQKMSQCPQSKVVLSGYSQGAEQVHGALKVLGRDAAKIGVSDSPSSFFQLFNK
jgi:hypothetical protein